MGLIVLIVFVLVIAGLVVWFYIKNKKPEPPKPDPSSGDTPDSGDTEPVDSGDTEPVDSGDTPDSGDTEPVCVADSETHRIQGSVSYQASSKRVKVGWYDTESICDGVWSIIGTKNGEDFLSDIKFENGDITAIVAKTNDGDKRTTRYLTCLTGKDVSKNDFFDVTQANGIDKKFEELLNAFSGYVKVERNGETYNYLKKLYDEANAQFEGKTKNGIPLLYKEENFPNIYNFYGEKDDTVSSYKTLIGWLFALQLSELKPKARTHLFKIGYELGGYNKYSNIYGYKFTSDPNAIRLVAAAIYASMRGIIKPKIDTMRAEVGGSKYNDTLETLGNGNKEEVSDDDFFIDFREFMPTAPGPYAPGFTTRPDSTYPDEKKDNYKNLDMDHVLHEFVVKNYNIDNPTYSARTVQAIADEEVCAKHLFGNNKTVGEYQFSPVFGQDTIGMVLPDDGALASLISNALKASSSSRGILQSAKVDPKQYGRLRPGCSWKQEGIKNSASDDKRNVLCQIEIEDNDGCKNTANSIGYYNKDGIWVYTQAEEDKLCETQKNSLWANSYPSGHSSGIWGGAMVLMELLPKLSDKIMAAANMFAVNRTVARYHWNSDTINGRVLGSATNAVSHASSDYDSRLEEIRTSLK